MHSASPLVRSLCWCALSLAAHAQSPTPPGEGPALGEERITQAQVEAGAYSMGELRRHGLRVFATPFNVHDGFGDGPVDPAAPLEFGGRPTLQNNGSFLRVNGLDAQSCLECHSIGSAATIPARFAAGGAGLAGTNVLFQPTEIDVIDAANNGFAAFDGRFINPPFLFGAGPVELLAKEMTLELAALRAQAQARPGLWVGLQTKGTSFGELRVDPATGELDLSRIEGVDEDLVVRPFGRKGDNASVRAFARAAMQFHFGIQPTEVVGEGEDGDGDGVTDELLAGELSALHVWATSLRAPVVQPLDDAAWRGLATFDAIGCTSCHTPVLETRGRRLAYTHPEVEADPSANVFLEQDLAALELGLPETPSGGLRVPLFSDMKRHDMGAGLAESHDSPLDSQFLTARLWGVADTAPYLHDGRATTLTEAIVLHGGEGQASAEAFQALAPAARVDLLSFLRSLRTPRVTEGG